MAEDRARPNPEELLARAQAEEKQAKRGKLKIFLGYAAGVGKTYTMLEAAHQRQKDTDVVVAIAETHGRKETEAFLKGLEIIPRKAVEYRGTVLTEMDLGAVLARHPKLALVDELAHENVPDSLHPKRYQDVAELLDGGIDVYTTLNIQHVESMRDSVAQITGVWVRETVPDSVIDDAAEVELVDLPPDELLKRLKEGKVYVPEQIALAADKFFQKGNLLALRELAMRTAGRHADEQTLAYMRSHGIRGPWASGERLLVCIGADSMGAHLIRSARRLAYELAAEWSALFVETPEYGRLPAQRQDQLANTLRLAEGLGAKTVTVKAGSVASACIQHAAANNITKIVVARPPRRSVRRLFRRPLAEELARRSVNVDVHVVSGGEPPKEGRPEIRSFLGNWKDYVYALLLVAAATSLAYLVRDLFTPANLVMLYLLCVGIAAVFWGFGPSILVSIVGVLAFDFFFVPPFLTFTVRDTEYVLTFGVLLLVGIVISYLMRRIRQQAEASVRREKETAALYSLGRDLSVSNSLQSYVRAIIERAKATFGRDAVIYLPFAGYRETLKPYAERLDASVDGNEMAAAIWSFQHQRAAGRGTDTLPNAGSRYVPLSTARGMVGVMALSAPAGTDGLSLEQERLLGAFADLAAVAIEGMHLADEAQDAQILSQVLKDTERLQTALLNSISHDLRTPLVSIIGVLSSLQEEGMGLDEAARRSMIQVARDEAERLNRLITNLLDVSRIEAGAMKVDRHPADVQEIVGAALEQLGEQARKRTIKLSVPPDLPFISLDSGLMVQALFNVIDNAIKYSPEGSPVEIAARQEGHDIVIAVADLGPGIPEKDRTHVFDKFYRIQRPDKVTGTGLGLSICKGIVEAHGGSVAAENRIGGGTIIAITLPIKDPKAPQE